MRRDSATLGWAGWGSLTLLWEPGGGDGGRGFKEGDRASRFWRGVGLQLRREERLRRTTAGDLLLPRGVPVAGNSALGA